VQFVELFVAFNVTLLLQNDLKKVYKLRSREQQLYYFSKIFSTLSQNKKEFIGK